ncbi:hypothetical protein D0O09_31755 [Pseudomonas putida]|nr:hypothetical protein D0O09_31755 [Pseudomonas putida]
MLTEFTLASVYYDDYILIKKSNGTYLFSGPYGGTELSLFSKRQKLTSVMEYSANRELGKKLGGEKPKTSNLIPYLVAGVKQSLKNDHSCRWRRRKLTSQMYARMLCNGPCTENMD